MSHGRSYHQFFEGYSECVRVDPLTGRKTTERFYTGYYFEPRLSPQGKKLRRLEYGGLYLAALLCFIVTGVLRADSNTRLPAILMMLATLVGLLWMILSLFSYLTAGEKLTEGEYRARNSLLNICKGLAVGFCVSAAMRLGCMIGYGRLSSAADWLTVAGTLLDGGILYWIHHREKTLGYTRTLSTVKAPFDSYDIVFHGDAPVEREDG